MREKRLVYRIENAVDQWIEYRDKNKMWTSKERKKEIEEN